MALSFYQVHSLSPESIYFSSNISPLTFLDQCVCDKNYFGDRCQYKDECESDEDCLNGGRYVKKIHSIHLILFKNQFFHHDAAEQRGGTLGSHPAARRSILGIAKIFVLNVAEIHLRHCLEQRTEA